MRSSGFTLAEMVVTLLIAVLILSVGIPLMTGWLSKDRLKEAAERIYADFEYARLEAIRRNRPVVISFIKTSDSIWCYGFKENARCDCLQAAPGEPDFCELDGVPQRRDSGAMTGIKLKYLSFNHGSIAFSPLRATLQAGSVQLESSSAGAIHIVLQSNGYIRVCSPAGAGNVWDYPMC